MPLKRFNTTTSVCATKMTSFSINTSKLLKIGIDKNGAAIYRANASGLTYNEYNGRDWYNSVKRQAAYQH
jgi:hypothetical protein